MPYLIDAHHIAARQTGNETWIRNVARLMPTIADPDEVAFAATAAGASAVKSLTGVNPVVVGESSVRRVLIDLPRAVRQVAADALLVQYTMPIHSVTPTVVMIHDLSAFDPRSREWLPPAFRLRVRFSIRSAVRRAKALLAPSEFTRHQLVELCGADPSRIRLAGNAVDPDLDSLIQARGVDGADDENRKTVLAVGNVLPRKNLAVLGRALAKLRSQGTDVELRVVGSVPGKSRDIVHSLESLLPNALTVTGYVTQNQLAAEYARADVFVFPSLFEGFGIPVLEALSAGIPVIVSDKGSLPEVAGSVGVVVPAEDEDAWARAIASELATRSEESTLARKAHARSYSWATSAQAVMQALRSSEK